MLRPILLSLAIALPLPALAEGLTRITDAETFISTVQNRDLTSMAVRLNIIPDGTIAGRAFGLQVTGTWTWDNGYFCRTLDTATQDFPLNCQLVETDSTTIRFTADKGTGDVANLRIK